MGIHKSYTSLISLALFIGLMSFGAQVRAQWGGAGLFTEQGLEVTTDSRVFSLFALLNASGFSQEEKLGPGPLFLPVFSDARHKFRDGLRRPGPSVKKFQEITQQMPGSIAQYLGAALELKPKEFKSFKKSSALAKKLKSPLKTWFAKEGGSPAFREHATAVKATQKKLLQAANPLTKAIASHIRFGEDEVIDSNTGENRRTSIIVNALDSFGSQYRVSTKKMIHVVAGPLRDGKDIQSIARAGAMAYAKTLVEAAAKKSKGGALAKAFKSLTKEEQAKFSSASDFASEVVGCALLKVSSKGPCDLSPLENVKSKDALVNSAAQKIKASDAAKELASLAIAKWFL